MYTNFIHVYLAEGEVDRPPAVVFILFTSACFFPSYGVQKPRQITC